jgi:hypothetical protein
LPLTLLRIEEHLGHLAVVGDDDDVAKPVVRRVKTSDGDYAGERPQHGLALTPLGVEEDLGHPPVIGGDDRVPVVVIRREEAANRHQPPEGPEGWSGPWRSEGRRRLLGLLRALQKEGADLAVPQLRRLPEDLREPVAARVRFLDEPALSILELIASARPLRKRACNLVR